MRIPLQCNPNCETCVAMARRYAPIAEGLALLALTLPLATGLHRPELWFLAPFLALTVTKRSYVSYGLTLQGAGSLGFHAAVATVVFVPYALGHYLFAHWGYGASFSPHLPSSFLPSVWDQVLVVALPEEFFFRGYLQTQFDRVWGKPYHCLGAHCGVGLPIAAALFAACHTIYGGPARLIVFFPGLWYGWLRARTETIAVPTAYHAASNLLMQIMLSSLRV